MKYKGESYSPGDPEYPELLLKMMVGAIGVGALLGWIVAIAWLMFYVFA